MKQLTKEQAIAFGENKCYEDMSLYDRAYFQLEQELLCMPFDVFHEAVEALLGRPVWTHEFARPDLLLQEANGEKEAPTFDEIMSMVPKEKLCLVITPEEKEEEKC